MATEYTISTSEPACIAVEEVASITISRCDESVATGELVQTLTVAGATVWFYSSTDRLVKILDAHDNGSVTGVPADMTAYCAPEVVVCASTGVCAECTENEVFTPLITYGGPYTYTIYQDSASIIPTNDGAEAESWAITPALPAGLSFDTETGIITGTPTASASAAYTVTATSAIDGSTDTADVTITTQPDALLTSSMLAGYLFEEATGTTTVLDASGNDISGEATGTTKTRSTDGTFAYYVVNNSPEENVDVPTASTYTNDLNHGTGVDYTVSHWIYFADTIPTGNTSFIRWAGTASTMIGVIKQASNFRIDYTRHSTGTLTNIYIGAITFPTNQWVHLAYRTDQADNKMYVTISADTFGDLYDSNSFLNEIRGTASGGNIQIASNSGTGDKWTNDRAAQVYIFNQNIGRDEVERLYGEGSGLYLTSG